MSVTESGNSLASNPGQTVSRPESERVFSQELVMALAHHCRLLLLGPLLVALVAYIIAAIMPGQYSSAAYLRMDRATARSLVALMTSPSLADKVLTNHPETGETPEGRIRFLTKNLGLNDIEPQGDRASVRLFRLEISHWDPRVAQAINSQLIDAWLETTLPPPVERRNLEAELQRNKTAAASNSALIEQLQKEATNLVMPNSIPGEIATPISSLIAKRDQNLASIISLENKLAGIPRDIIVAPPHLPFERSWPKKGAIAFLSGVAAIPLFFLLVLLSRRFAPGLTVRAALSQMFRRHAT